MDAFTVIKELGRIKHNCKNISFEDCMQGSCPYHGKKLENPIKVYDDDTDNTLFNTHNCLFDDIGMNPPYDWEIPEEVL